jgi:hypothetical protein
MLEEQNGKEGTEREGGERTGEKGLVFLEASVRDPRGRGRRGTRGETARGRRHRPRGSASERGARGGEAEAG